MTAYTVDARPANGTRMRLVTRRYGHEPGALATMHDQDGTALPFVRFDGQEESCCVLITSFEPAPAPAKRELAVSDYEEGTVLVFGTHGRESYEWLLTEGGYIERLASRGKRGFTHVPRMAGELVLHSPSHERNVLNGLDMWDMPRVLRGGLKDSAAKEAVAEEAKVGSEEWLKALGADALALADENDMCEDVERFLEKWKIPHVNRFKPRAHRTTVTIEVEVEGATVPSHATSERGIGVRGADLAKALLLWGWTDVSVVKVHSITRGDGVPVQ